MNILYADGKVFAAVPEADDYDPPAWKPARCRCCGARLDIGQIKCDYCGKARPLKENVHETY